MSEEIALPAELSADSAQQPELELSGNVEGLTIVEPTPENGNTPTGLQPTAEETKPKVADENKVGHTQDTNLIDIINSMEEDRKKFIAHVHNKIASQDSEFEVTFFCCDFFPK